MPCFCIVTATDPHLRPIMVCELVASLPLTYSLCWLHPRISSTSGHVMPPRLSPPCHAENNKHPKHRSCPCKMIWVPTKLFTSENEAKRRKIHHLQKVHRLKSTFCLICQQVNPLFCCRLCAHPCCCGSCCRRCCYFCPCPIDHQSNGHRRGCVSQRN